jgi:hypothetical protein
MTFWGWGYWVIVGLLVGLIVAVMIIPNRTKKLAFLQRQVILKSVAAANVFGWLMLVWLFFRYEGIRYLSWRFWPVLIIIYALVQAGLIIKFARVDFPKKRASKITGQEKEKYLRRYLDKK